MEITLNLIPPNLLRQREVQRRKRARILAVAWVVVPILLTYAVLNARIHVLQQRVARLDRGVAAFSEVAAKTRRLENDSTDLRRRESALRGLTVRLPRGSAVLVELSSLVPRDVWFTSISIADGRLTVDGRALSESGVSALTTRLASDGLVAAPSVKYVRAESLGAGQIYTFEINGVVRAEGQNP